MENQTIATPTLNSFNESSSSSLKVLRPSAKFLNDTHAERSKPNVTARSFTAANPQIPVNSIDPTGLPLTYPTPTTGFGSVESHTNPNINIVNPGETSADKKEKKSILPAIIIVSGGLMVVSAISGIIFGVKLSSIQNSGLVSDGVVSIAIYTAYILLGIGLIFRKNLARLVYLGVSVMFFILMVIGTAGLFSISAREQSVYAQSIKQSNVSIQTYENNTSVPTSVKQPVLNDLKNLLAKDQAQQASYNALFSSSVIHGLVRSIPFYLLSIIPFVFFTRQSVKKYFS